ncbi:aldose 1-epimerase family protein [Liquorilactobacillus oeni]|uniref:aldose 1-epimerase family protein n=1 Tax=Liquorilactobacillus oeni TaxID=303241 RepID=UPI00070AA57B|nr:aldose 1-epimerase family protein [Liquorilactobacillus oeni]
MTVTLENEQLKAVFTENGAEMVSLFGKEKRIEYLWQADPKFWGRHAPVLFPIVGRLKDDHYRFGEQSYELHQHGFARDQQFSLTKKTAELVTFTLSSSEVSKSKYPFDFILRVTYQLYSDKVSVSYNVENPSSKELYFSIGGHPAFNVPLTKEGDSFENYHVEILPYKKRKQIGLVGNYTDLAHAQIKDIAQIALSRKTFSKDAVILELQEEQTTLLLTNKKEDCGVRLQMEDAQYCGIWSPYPADAPFVCLEPWWGLADDLTASGKLSEKQAIHALPAYAKFTGNYAITVF